MTREDDKLNYVFNKLPEDIQDKIESDVDFYLLGEGDLGGCIGYTDKYCIIINCPLIPNLRTFRYTIAHEVAHYILGHGHIKRTDSISKNNQDEKEADALAEKWGFTLEE